MENPDENEIRARSEELLTAHRQTIYRRTDRLFASLMAIQWVAGVLAAFFVSPRAWEGEQSSTHLHVWIAVLLGGLISALPIGLALCRPGAPVTRHVIALAQALTSALLIHLSGGRIETHFHVFGSLAFLACYRDWRVLVSATVVVAVDHWLRGVYFPQSVYGVLFASEWRLFEHVAWVVFEDVFLLVTIHQSSREMARLAQQRAHLEASNERVEEKIRTRTAELNNALALTAKANLELEGVVKDLETRNRELDELTEVASHDLQEPVRRLVSFSTLLRQDVGPGLNERAETDLKFIEDGARRMQLLVQDLVELSLVGRCKLRPETFSLESCVDAALQGVEERVEVTGARIVRDALPTVRGDWSMLRTLYEQLLANALTFLGERAPIVRVTAEEDEEGWVLGVSDNGIGIREKYRDKIFAPFRRLHRRDQYGGTGIGLSICKKAVDRHGGDIWVESELGVGSHFRFRLAAVASEAVESTADAIGDPVADNGGDPSREDMPALEPR